MHMYEMILYVTVFFVMAFVNHQSCMTIFCRRFGMVGGSNLSNTTKTRCFSFMDGVKTYRSG